jgi:hypothetical protein
VSSKLLSALVSALRSNDGLVELLAEDRSTPGATKIHAMVAFGSPSLPYIVMTETSEKPIRQSADAASVVYGFCRGNIVVKVHAASSDQAQLIGDTISGILADTTIVPTDGTLLEFRDDNAYFDPIGGVGPGSSTEAVYVVSYLYVIQRALGRVPL